MDVRLLRSGVSPDRSACGRIVQPGPAYGARRDHDAAPPRTRARAQPAGVRRRAVPGGDLERRGAGPDALALLAAEAGPPQPARPAVGRALARHRRGRPRRAVAPDLRGPGIVVHRRDGYPGRGRAGGYVGAGGGFPRRDNRPRGDAARRRDVRVSGHPAGDPHRRRDGAQPPQPGRRPDGVQHADAGPDRSRERFVAEVAGVHRGGPGDRRRAAPDRVPPPRAEHARAHHRERRRSASPARSSPPPRSGSSASACNPRRPSGARC